MNKNILNKDLVDSNINISTCIPDWVKILEVDNHVPNEEGSIVHLLIDHQYKIAQNTVTKFSRIVQKPITMEGVQECSRVMIEFNPKDLGLIIHNIDVTRGQIKSDKLESADMQVLRREYQAERNVISGDITLSIILDDIKENDIIEMSYSLINSNSIEVTHFNKFIQLEFSVPIAKFHQSIISPVKLETNFFGEQYPIIETVGNSTFYYEILLKNIPAKKIINSLPWEYPITLLQIAMQLKWKDISTSCKDFFEIIQINRDILTQLKSEAIANNLSNETIIILIMRYINKNIRYLFNHNVTSNFQPGDPNLAIDRGYGDCKDLVSVFRSLLDAFSIPSIPVLVNSQYGRVMDNYLPAMTVFDHVILRINCGEKVYYIDPTIRQNVSNLENLYLPNFGLGLVCDGLTENLAHIKNQFSCDNHISVTDEYFCLSWEKNEFTYESNVTMTGLQALKFKQMVDNEYEARIWENLENYYSKFINIENVIERRILDTDNVDNKIGYVFRCKASLKFYAKKDRNYTIEMIPMDIIDHIYNKLPPQIDTDIYYGQTISINYDINVIDGNVKFTGQNQTVVEDDAFSLSKISKGMKGKYEFQFKFIKVKDVIQKSRYAEFLSKHDQAMNIIVAGVTKHGSSIFSRLLKEVQFYATFIIIFLIISYFRYHGY